MARIPGSGFVRAIALLAVGVLGTSIMPTPGVGQAITPSTQLSTKEHDRFQFVMSGLKTGKERLRSGAYRAFGRKQDGQQGNVRFPYYSGDVEIFAAFDFDREIFRFDRREPVADWALDFKSKEVSVINLKYAKTPKESIESISDWDERAIRTKGTTHIKSSDAPVHRDLRPMDVRNLAMCDWFSMKLATPFPEVFEFLSQVDHTTQCIEEQAGIYRVEKVYEESGIRNVYWFDEAQGFSPIRAEGMGRENGKWLEPVSICRMTWQEINGVWVPKTFSNNDTQNDGILEQYDLTFDWLSVNGQVENDLFTLENISNSEDLKKTIGPVIDDRLGRRIIVKQVGDDAKAKEPKDARLEPQLDVSRNYRTHWVIGLNVVAAIVLLAFWFRRRSVSRRHGG